MFELTFDRVEATESQLICIGALARATVSLSKGGIWHFCISGPNAEKGPWVATVSGSLPLTVSHKGKRVIVESKETSASLELSLAPFKWSIHGTQFSVQHSENRTKDGLHKRRNLTLLWEENNSRRYYGLGERTG
ncbi:MAG: hypothetical protein P1V97_37045, partial [Planctomycetota bacterium]|nr:hypothetical protein [Planctomycetota bacterium]